MSASLVGSEMCIRDRTLPLADNASADALSCSEGADLNRLQRCALTVKTGPGQSTATLAASSSAARSQCKNALGRASLAQQMRQTVAR
eukprot:9776608-Alexandrium_andersonii.AAC.1